MVWRFLASNLAQLVQGLKRITPGFSTILALGDFALHLRRFARFEGKRRQIGRRRIAADEPMLRQAKAMAVIPRAERYQATAYAP